MSVGCNMNIVLNNQQKDGNNKLRLIFSGGLTSIIFMHQTFKLNIRTYIACN